MFTGLIEAVGRLIETKPTPTGLRLRLVTPLAASLAPGDSLAVNGVCLTVISASADEVHADVSPETARVTTLGSLARDARVNLERPLRLEGRLGGHFVQGHVDGVGKVEEVRRQGDCYWITVQYPPALAQYIVHKGSIAIDGVSLTVAGLSDRQVDVQIVPYTWEHTNMHRLAEGSAVNLECDVIGKYVARAMELAAAADSRPADRPAARPPGTRS
jgi:riboflavin synthase